MKQFILLISIFTAIGARATIKRCGGSMISIDDRIQIKLEYTIDYDSNTPYGEAIVINTNTKTQFSLHCFDEIINNEYFICVPREDYIGSELLVFLSGEVRLIKPVGNRNSYYILSKLSCDSPYIEKLIKDKEWLLD